MTNLMIRAKVNSTFSEKRNIHMPSKKVVKMVKSKNSQLLFNNHQTGTGMLFFLKNLSRGVATTLCFLSACFAPYPHT